MRLVQIISFFCIAIYSQNIKAQKPKTIKKNVTAAYLAPTGAKSENFEISSGAFIFDATKRIGISNIYKNKDNTYTFRYLAEEQPDAIHEVIKSFLANIDFNKKDSLKIEATVNRLSNIIAKQLTNKSNSLNFLRSSLYRLNEAAFNNNIRQEDYAKLFKLIIENASKVKNITKEKD